MSRRPNREMSGGVQSNITDNYSMNDSSDNNTKITKIGTSFNVHRAIG